jgi:hypothetical protein
MQHSKQMRQATARVLARTDYIDDPNLDDLLLSDIVSDFEFSSTIEPQDF